jgi:hypothetical protein
MARRMAAAAAGHRALGRATARADGGRVETGGRRLRHETFSLGIIVFPFPPPPWRAEGGADGRRVPRRRPPRGSGSRRCALVDDATRRASVKRQGLDLTRARVRSARRACSRPGRVFTRAQYRQGGEATALPSPIGPSDSHVKGCEKQGRRGEAAATPAIVTVRGSFGIRVSDRPSEDRGPRRSGMRQRIDTK